MSQARPTIHRLLLAAVILSTCIGCDQATKRIATQSLQNSPPRVYLAGALRLEYALNPGGFLSLGSRLPDQARSFFFIGFNVCMLLAVCGYLIYRRNMPWALFVAIAYFLAGGIGNLIDRVTNGGLVIDFINVGIGPLRTGIFNVADVAVTFGAIAAVILAGRKSRLEQANASPG